MAFEKLSSPIPEISAESKRQIPDFLLEEERARRRLLTPEIKRPERPMYAFVRNFTPDLKPSETTMDMEFWYALRRDATGELNYPRWSRAIVVDGVEHTVALCGVSGEAPGGKQYIHSTLRCSCCLPDYKSYTDLKEEYQPCPAKDLVIDERTDVYREVVGGDEIRNIDDESLYKAVVFLVGLAQKNRFSWPPSDRSDRLLVDPMAKVYGIPKERMRAGAKEMADRKIVKLHGEQHPSISLAA